MPVRSITKPVMALLIAFAIAGDASAALTLAEVTRQLEASGKRVLAAQRKQHKGREMYRVKVLTPEGRVRKLWVDPRSGRSVR